MAEIPYNRNKLVLRKMLTSAFFKLNPFITVKRLFAHASVSKIVILLRANKYAEFDSFIIKHTIPCLNSLTNRAKKASYERNLSPMILIANQ